MELSAIQQALCDERLDGWLFYDHHHRDPLAYKILGLPLESMVTRRWYYLIPAQGEPRKLCHRIEAGKLDSLPGELALYSSWQELEERLRAMTAGYTRLAMQYSPRNAIMSVAMADAGTVELQRSFGHDIVSSANLISQFEAVLTDRQIASHFAAASKIDAILAEAWLEIGRRVRNWGTNEHQMVQYLVEAMRREGLTSDHGPNVSVGPNTADSHYDPTPESSRPIRQGDFVLIDIFGKLHAPDSVYYDVCWTAVVGREPSERERHIFHTVRTARETATATIAAAFAAGKPIAGYEADDASRRVIDAAGFGPWFTHRTGHNIGSQIHGNGAHLDNLETHDERLLLANTCFSVEPGIYFPGDFGVRSEVDMVTRKGSAEITGRVQNELVRI